MFFIGNRRDYDPELARLLQRSGSPDLAEHGNLPALIFTAGINLLLGTTETGGFLLLMICLLGG